MESRTIGAARRRAEAAMLDDAADRVARLVGRREGDEQRVVAQRPGSPGRRPRSPAPSTCAVPVLPAIWMPSSGSLDATAGAVLVDDRGHGVADESRDAPGRRRGPGRLPRLAASAVAAGAASRHAIRAGITASCSGLIST